MTSPGTVVETMIRSTLVAFPALVPLVGQKVYSEHVPDSTALPYIVMFHLSGGQDRNTEYALMRYKVQGVTADRVVAEQLRGHIHDALHYAEGVTIGTACLVQMNEVMPVFDRFVVQNNPIFYAGGIFDVIMRLS